MAVTVAEIMNHELFSVRGDEHAEEVVGYLLALGISGAPVLDESARPIGFISLRDLVRCPANTRVLARMNAPADVVPVVATIREAAERMAEISRHHLVCVDDRGHAVGFVGSLDLVRGLLGRPTPHPDAFPHYDSSTGLTWSNDQQLSFAVVDSAPDGPGAFVLIEARPGHPNRVVWSEACANVRRRLRDMLATPASAPPHLLDAAVAGALWFRSAPSPSAQALLAAEEAL